MLGNHLAAMDYVADSIHSDNCVEVADYEPIAD